MSLSSLPVELIDNVVQDLDTASLAATAQASSIFCTVAQRVLYRHLSVSTWLHNLSVVHTLATKHHVAQYVRTFYISVDARAHVSTAFYRLLAQAIANMSELTTLNLLIDSSLSWVLPSQTNPVSYPSLTQFTCAFPLDQTVTRFLEKTPSLLELEMDSLPMPPNHHSPALSLPATLVPHLAQFVGSVRAAKAFVPGRPVKSIHLHGIGMTEEDVPHFAQSSVPVVVLGTVTSSYPVPFLESLHKHMPSLSCLRVMSTQNMFQPPTTAFYEQVASALTAFSDLTAFELSGMHWGSQPKSKDDAKRVWQSAPSANANTREEDPEPEAQEEDGQDLLFGTDIFFAY